MLANVGYKSGKQLVLELLHTAASAAACPTRLLQLFLEGTAPGLRAVNTPNAIELENHKPSHCTDWDIKESLASSSSSSLWQSLGWYRAAPATKPCTGAVDGRGTVQLEARFVPLRGWSYARIGAFWPSRNFFLRLPLSTAPVLTSSGTALQNTLRAASMEMQSAGFCRRLHDVTANEPMRVRRTRAS